MNFAFQMRADVIAAAAAVALCAQVKELVVVSSDSTLRGLSALECKRVPGNVINYKQIIRETLNFAKGGLLLACVR